MNLVVTLCIASLLACLASCAATDGQSVATANASAAQEIALTNRAGTVRAAIPVQQDGTFQLQAFGEELLGGLLSRSASSSASARQGRTRMPELWLDGVSVPGGGWSSTAVDAVLASNDWQYVFATMPATNAAGTGTLKRHLLCIEPDLVLVLDEVSLPAPALVETGFWFSRPPEHDVLRDEWTVQTPKAGVTTRFLTSPRSKHTLWDEAGNLAAGAVTSSAPRCVRSTTAEKVPEFYQATVLVVHPEQSRRSLAFKLLESDTAIGVRVHRDGLPTLAAFRKAGCIGEANLTGMKFNAPVAVDVFRPRKR